MAFLIGHLGTHPQAGTPCNVSAGDGGARAKRTTGERSDQDDCCVGERARAEQRSPGANRVILMTRHVAAVWLATSCLPGTGNSSLNVTIELRRVLPARAAMGLRRTLVW